SSVSGNWDRCSSAPPESALRILGGLDDEEKTIGTLEALKLRTSRHETHPRIAFLARHGVLHRSRTNENKYRTYKSMGRHLVSSPQGITPHPVERARPVVTWFGALRLARSTASRAVTSTRRGALPDRTFGNSSTSPLFLARSARHRSRQVPEPLRTSSP